MKKAVLVLLFSSITLFGYMIPSWYPNNQTNIIISYGDGMSLELAKEQALESVKDQLIKKASLTTLDRIKVEDLEILQQEVLENRYFIKASYQNLSTQQKIEKILKKQVFKIDDELNPYLITTPLLKDINNSFGYFANMSLDSNNTAFVELAGEKVELSIDDYPLFFSAFQDENLTLEMNQNLKPNEVYFLDINTNLSGYLNIIQISLEHDVVVLVENKEVNNQQLIYPNFKESDGLTAMLVGEQEEREIVTLAFVCEEQKDFRGFNNIFSTEIIHGKLGKVIDLLDGCRFSSVVSQIQSSDE